MTTFINLNEHKCERITFNKSGDYVVFLSNLSGKFVFDIDAPNVNLDIYGLYIGRSTEQFLINTVQHHRIPSSTSNLFIRGVFYNYSKFNYQGLIRIEKEAQKSHAYQKNQNLVLSPYCFVESKPYLEILANDVFCTHGSTTGKLDEEQLFYAKSRGIEGKEAEKILVEGFINKILFKIKSKVPGFEAKQPLGLIYS